jgi:cell division inhibitor SepF
MGARDYWDRMLVYFGIAEEAGHDDADADDWEEERPAASSRRGAPARRESASDVASARSRPSGQRASGSSGSGGSGSSSRPAPRRTAPPGQSVAGVGVVQPRTFNDAQKIADQFKQGVPVIVNFQTTDGDLAKRLIDFASGLTYGVDGSMSRIADKVFLLTPPDVEVSDEERAAIAESGFFNQS